MNEYASEDDIKTALELTGETFADPDIRIALSAASRGLDNVCSRRFYADDDATSVRYYSPDDRGVLQIDDLIDLTSLKTDPGGDGTFEDTWTENTDFVLEPLNAPADGWPWSTIRVHPNGSYRFTTCYPRTVELTGQFGWSAVPEPIREATIVLASKLMLRARQAPFGVVMAGLDSGSVMRIARNDPDVMFLAGPYIRHRIAVA